MGEPITDKKKKRSPSVIQRWRWPLIVTGMLTLSWLIIVAFPLFWTVRIFNCVPPEDTAYMPNYPIPQGATFLEFMRYSDLGIYTGYRNGIITEYALQTDRESAIAFYEAIPGATCTTSVGNPVHCVLGDINNENNTEIRVIIQDSKAAMAHDHDYSVEVSWDVCGVWRANP